jgi:hypothetical protein
MFTDKIVNFEVRRYCMLVRLKVFTVSERFTRRNPRPKISVKNYMSAKIDNGCLHMVRPQRLLMECTWLAALLGPANER